MGWGRAVSNCFWDIETSGKSSSAGGTGESTTAMKTQSTFTDVGWDLLFGIWKKEQIMGIRT